MTVYVDSARIPARVRNIQANWSHLTADTPTELHEFAQRIGMRRSWYQGKCSSAKRGKCTTLAGSCVHYHYDVTDSRRADAVAAGAQEIDLREMGDLIRSRREKLRGISTT